MNEFDSAATHDHMKRLALGIAALGWTAACAPAMPAERQQCIECALRHHTDTATPPHAKTRFQRACDAGDARSCSVLGVMYENGRGVQVDNGRAAELYGLSCRHGNARACVSFGSMMERGTSARSDLSGAETMYDVACRAGEPEGCHQLGRLVAERFDAQRGATMLGQTCEDGYAPACETLGLMVERGQGARASHARAHELFRRACEGGHTDACARL